MMTTLLFVVPIILYRLAYRFLTLFLVTGTGGVTKVERDVAKEMMGRGIEYRGQKIWVGHWEAFHHMYTSKRPKQSCRCTSQHTFLVFRVRQVDNTNVARLPHSSSLRLAPTA